MSALENAFCEHSVTLCIQRYSFPKMPKMPEVDTVRTARLEIMLLLLGEIKSIREKKFETCLRFYAISLASVYYIRFGAGCASSTLESWFEALVFKKL